MEKKLPPQVSDESIQRAVLQYGPKDTKLSKILGPKRMELFRAALKIVNPEKKDITVFYPRSGPDILNVLVATDATTLHLADKDQHTQEIIKRIENTGGTIQNQSSFGDKNEIYFEWGGKDRKVVFHQGDVDNSNIDKLLADVGQYDIYLEKKSDRLGNDPEIRAKLLGNLKIGGHAILDYEAERHIGFEQERLASKYERADYKYGYYRMRVYRKDKSVSDPLHMMRFNETFSDVVSSRNGGDLGVDESALEIFKRVYPGQLAELKALYDAIPEAKEKESIKKEIIKELYEKEVDISQVFGTRESYRREIEYLDKQGLLTQQAYEVIMEREVHEYKKEQVKEFREEGRKIFEKVFPEWV